MIPKEPALAKTRVADVSAKILRKTKELTQLSLLEEKSEDYQWENG